jgi:hypothetical protein
MHNAHSNEACRPPEYLAVASVKGNQLLHQEISGHGLYEYVQNAFLN